MRKGYVISDDSFHKFIVRRLMSFIDETDDYMMINFHPTKYNYPEWQRVYLNVLMDEIHPFLYGFKNIPHDKIYDEIRDTLTVALKEKMKSLYNSKRISESVSVGVKRRGDRLFSLARTTYPYLHPCDFDRENYVDNILRDLTEIVMDDYPVGVDLSDASEYVRKVHGDHFLFHWDYNCDGAIINESQYYPDVKDKSVEELMLKSFDRGLTQLLNSNVFKDIYPMIEKAEVYYLEDLNRIVVRIFVDDPEMTKDNMYNRGLDPHYLIDNHLMKFLPYFNYPKSVRTGFVVMGPDKKHISDWIS